MNPELIQGTDEWLSMRRNYIGASDAPAIMGISPWTTPYMVWSDKMGLAKNKPVSHAMKRGNDLEPIARSYLEDEFKVKLQPRVVFHPTIKFMMASMDAMMPEGNDIAFEIKCPGKQDHDCAMDGEVPRKYYAQLQHQMEVCGLDSMYYFSFDGQNGKLLEVGKDVKYIKNLVEKEREFWDCVLNFEPPALSDKDYITRSDDLWNLAARKYIDTNEQYKELEKKRECARQSLVSLCSGQNTQGANVRLSRTVRKGNIDYKSVPELMNVDLEAYRGKSIESWRIS